SSGCLTLNSNTGPVGRSLRRIAPWMPQRRYTFWAKLATPSFSVCKTTPRSSKYLPKQATAYAAAALQQGFVILWRRISFLTSCEKLNDLPPPRSGRKLSQRPLRVPMLYAGVVPQFLAKLPDLASKGDRAMLAARAPHRDHKLAFPFLYVQRQRVLQHVLIPAQQFP